MSQVKSEVRSPNDEVWRGGWRFCGCGCRCGGASELTAFSLQLTAFPSCRVLTHEAADCAGHSSRSTGSFVGAGAVAGAVD